MSTLLSQRYAAAVIGGMTGATVFGIVGLLCGGALGLLACCGIQKLSGVA